LYIYFVYFHFIHFLLYVMHYRRRRPFVVGSAMRI